MIYVRKGVILTLITIFVLTVIVTAAFCGCSSTNGISLAVGDGNPFSYYPGAELTLSTDGGEGARFSILHGEDCASVSGNLLFINEDAAVGSLITLKVTVGSKSSERTIEVVPVPPESITVNPVEPFAAGGSVTLSVTIFPEAAREHTVSYAVEEGADYATVNDDVLTFKQTASKDSVIKITATAGGVTSPAYTVACNTVHPTDITITNVETELERGEQLILTALLSPEDVTVDKVSYVLTEGSGNITLENNLLTVKNDALIGATVKLYAVSENARSEIYSFKIAATKVTSVTLSAGSAEIPIGKSLPLSVEVAPSNATYNRFTVEFTEGGDKARFDAEECRVYLNDSAKVGDVLKLKATADGVTSDELILTVCNIPVESVIISVDDGENLSVAAGQQRVVAVSVFPLDATNPEYTLFVEDGEGLASVNGDTITFDRAAQGSQITVRAYADGVGSNTLTFTVVAVPVTSVTITPVGRTTGLVAGDQISFESTVLPENATNNIVYYSVISDYVCGSFTDNIFTVAPHSRYSKVIVQGFTADGVESNTVELDVIGDYTKIAYTEWSKLDNKTSLTSNYDAIWLDLTLLPYQADNTTVIIGDSVESLIIEGKYDGDIATCFTDLYFYFLTQDAIDVTFIDLGIRTAQRYGGTVIDFGTYSTVTLSVEGNNYVEAGSPYAPYTGDGMVVGGLWDATSSTNYVRKHGMDGVGGENGGIAIQAFRLAVEGEGSLTLKGGNGASGTDGMDGASAPCATTVNKGGNGGDGGYGGDSGYGVYCYYLTVNMDGELNAYSGNAGAGGGAGKGGTAQTAVNAGELSSIAGTAGVAGASGKVNAPLYAVGSYVRQKGDVTVLPGVVAVSTDNPDVNAATLVSVILSLESYYKVDIHYGTDLSNPYSDYKMTRQTTLTEITRLVQGLIVALAKFPKNLYIDLTLNKGNDINIYLTDTISKSGSTIYGLTSNANKIWFATFTTRLRDSFYSNYYNIMAHELLHMLTFGLSASLSNNPLKAGLSEYNNGYAYTVNERGVYNVLKDKITYNAANSAFLTMYSKNNFNEDVSDNLSLIIMLAQDVDFLDNGRIIAEKVKYITGVYSAKYESIASWVRLSWLKFL